MAEEKKPVKKKKVDKKGKKDRKNKVVSKRFEKYEVKEGKVKRKQFCPRCGPGYFLAQHKDRVYCGKCGYMEVKKKE